MAQTITLDMTPGTKSPTIYFSQGDIGTTFDIDLTSRFGDSLPVSPTITIQATKPSGLGFTVSATSISGSVVTFTTTETMTNEAGRFQAELKIVKSSVTIFTANFYMQGEASAHPEGTTDGDLDSIMPKFMSVTTTTLSAGSSATYSYNPTTNTATFGIPKGADGSLASQVLAADYSSSKTYAVGDYVYYSGNLYRCTTAITTAEAWTSGHWTQVALANDVSDVKSDLSYEKDRLGDYLFNGLFVPPLELSRGSINTSTGEDQANNYRVRTNKIYFGDADIIYCALKQGYSLYWYVYDSADNLIGKNGWNNYTSIGDKTMAKSQYTGAHYVRIVFQIQDASTTVLPIETAYQFKVYTFTKPVSPYCYVAPNGNDSNSGTKASPFATVQSAVNKGFKNICIVAGEYHQSLAVSNVDGLNIYADNTDEYVSYTKKPKPVFTNGTFFDTFSTDGSGYKYFALSSDDAPSTYKAVFINHTQQPIITGDYPSYRAGLWANHSNKYDDFRVKPVLTYEELSENNTFYYDGTNVYFHIEDAVTGVTMGGATSYIFNFTNCNDLTVNGIDFMYADSMNFQVLKSNNVKVSNCNFGYTMRSNCVTASYSNVVFENCEAFKATIDGFNSHYYGVSVFNNCRGVYNYDDGESSHEYCEVIVHGGEYAYNGKGGHAPVNGCKFKCDSTYTHHNKYGFYMVGSSSFDTADILISNSVAKNNVTYDLQNTIYNTKIWNNIIGTSHISSGTVTDLSA